MKIGILTSLPGGPEPKSGIAYYSQALLEALDDTADELVIFADGKAESKDSPSERRVSGARVIQCWQFGIRAPFQILRALMRNRVDALHVEYDVYLYGGVVSALLLPLVLQYVRVRRGIRVVATIHGVVPRDVITRKMLSRGGFVLPFTMLGRLGFSVMYRLFDWATDSLVVLEEWRARVLERDYGVASRKIHVVPLPLMHDCPRPRKEEARVRCGIVARNHMLYFGYASYYKGLDVLLDAFRSARLECEDLALTIVAGRHPRLAGNPRYERFYAALRERSLAEGAVFAEFLPEPQLVDMLAAADVAVLPYTDAYGASGALNTAIAARRPVLVSRHIGFDGALPCQIFEPNAPACARAMLAFFSEHAAMLNDRTEALAQGRDARTISRAIHSIRCGRAAVTRSAVEFATARR